MLMDWLGSGSPKKSVTIVESVLHVNILGSRVFALQKRICLCSEH